MITYIAMCISMDGTTPFGGYLQRNRCCIGITELLYLKLVVQWQVKCCE